MPCSWSSVAGEGGGLRPPVQLGLGASVLSEKGQVQSVRLGTLCPPGTTEARPPLHCGDGAEWPSPARTTEARPPLHCGDGGRMAIPRQGQQRPGPLCTVAMGAEWPSPARDNRGPAPSALWRRGRMAIPASSVGAGLLCTVVMGAEWPPPLPQLVPAPSALWRWGRMAIPRFLGGGRNHLWTQQAEQNLGVKAAKV